MDDGHLSRYSACDDSQVFSEYKEALKAVGFRTPLQRAHRLVMKCRSIALQQRQELRAEKAFNLLPPGCNTKFDIDFFDILRRLQQQVSLPIPVTLLSTGSDTVLLRCNASGRVVIRTLADDHLALQHFAERTSDHSPGYPQFVHKTHLSRAAFHRSLPTAAAAWQSTRPRPQRLQQFISPPKKVHSVLRAHYKAARGTVAYYSISQGKRTGEKLPGLHRSMSEADLQASFEPCGRGAQSDEVQRLSKVSPDLMPSLLVCVKVLGAVLQDCEALSEVVCDFTMNRRQQWVFLSCQGLSFTSAQQQVTQLLERQLTIDLKCLMYPVVVRRKSIQHQLQCSKKPMEATVQPAAMLQCLTEVDNDYSPKIQPVRVKPQVPVQLPKKYQLEQEFISRQVSHFESLRSRSQCRREESNQQVDFLQKYDTLSVSLCKFLETIHEEELVAQYFPDRIGHEEVCMISSAFLRVLRGDFNLYYREALKRIHSRRGIQSVHFYAFLGRMEGAIAAAINSATDTRAIMQRFESLQGMICAEFRTDINR